MKALILLFFIGMSSSFGQVNCSGISASFSGTCETFNSVSGIRGKVNYKKGVKHGEIDESYSNGQLRALGKNKSGYLHGDFTAYYITGELMTAGKFKSGTGSFTIYYATGQKRTIGQFTDGVATGTWTNYSDRGDVTEEIKLENSKLEMYAVLVGEQKAQNRSALSNFFNFPGSNGFSFSFEDVSDSSMLQIQQRMNESMKRMELLMQQLATRFGDTSSRISFRMEGFEDFNKMFQPFNDSSEYRSYHFDTIIGDFPKGLKHFPDFRSSELVDFPDTEPEYVGGVEAMKSFIESEMKYPDITRENMHDRMGTVFVEVIVEKDGSLTNPRIALGVIEPLDEEALRIVGLMPNWKPATSGGSIVRTRSIIPIHFELN